MSLKSDIGILMGTLVNSKMCPAMFPTVILPIHEHRMASCLLMSSSMFQGFRCRSLSLACVSDLGYIFLFLRTSWVELLLPQFIPQHTHYGCVEQLLILYSTVLRVYCQGLLPLACVPSFFSLPYLTMNDVGGFCQWLILYLSRSLCISPNSMYVLFYDYWFTYAETSLHFRNETTMAYDIFTADEFCFTSILLRIVGSVFIKETYL